MLNVILHSKSVYNAAGCIHTISYFAKESLKASSRASFNSAKEVNGLQKAIEEEQWRQINLFQEEIKLLKGLKEPERVTQKESPLNK